MKKCSAKISESEGFLVINASLNYISGVINNVIARSVLRMKHIVVKYVCNSLAVVTDVLNTQNRG